MKEILFVRFNLYTAHYDFDHYLAGTKLMVQNNSAVTIFGIKNCDTMKKTFAWFEAQGIPYSFVDYKKSGVVEAQLPHWIAAVGWEVLLNRKGLTWKKLSESDRAAVDQAKASALMIAHPTLIKRPVVVAEEQTVIGFDEALLSKMKLSR
jgi:arsenate reductase (glutaredoxin)